ncbi:hypothetical protein [Dickeya zeae]|uniref:hypothetical protein n=1 Tax=Dickeya zeae TaxID=204042 RepID=UPI001F471F4E|nr:hypothetical protein [Dickeya zeae]UJR61286.1 hypothetical protein HJ586_03085 [Dickeya zeae]
MPLDHYYYQGKIGNTPIVMELVVGPDYGIEEGRYFSPDEHVMRPLSGTNKESEESEESEEAKEDDNSWKISLKLGHRADDANATAEQTLNLKGSFGNKLYGEFRENNAAPIAVTLLPMTDFPGEGKVAGASPFMKSVYNNSWFYAFFQQGYEPKMVKQGKVGEYAIEWWQDPLTHSSMFQVISGYSVEQRNQLNEALRDIFWRTLSEMSFCSNEKDLKVKIGLLSPNAVSYTLTGKFQCPDDSQSQIKVFTHTLSIRNPSAELSLSDLFWLDDLPVPVVNDYYDNGDDNGEWDLQQRLPEWLKGQFTQLYPAKMTRTSGASGQGCDYTATQTWANTRWSLTPEGIYFKPLRPDGTDVCDDEGWEVVPWHIVNQYPGRLQYVMVP